VKRALITGITGQDGLYLAEFLLAKGYEVHGIIRGQNNPKRELVVEAIVPEVVLHTGDLTDLSGLLRALHASQPDEVYNLGAVSFVAYSWENAQVTTEVTGNGVLNILEAIRLYAGDDVSKVRFYQASSSEMFGKVQEVPQRERHPALAPLPLRGRQGLRALHDHQLPRVLRHAREQRASSSTTNPRVAGRSSSPAR
jgi:GDPmannose 4,6-dehydratase